MTDQLQVRGGSVEEGLANGRRLLADHPRAALQQAVTLLKLGPDRRALRLAAAAHRALGDATQAEAAELAAIEAGLALPEMKAAARAEHEGRSGEASVIAARHLAREPDDLLAMTISAEAAIALKQLVRGEELLREVLGRAPGFLRASMFLARSLMLQSLTRDAVVVMEQAVTRAPHNIPAAKFLAQLQAEIRDFAAACDTYERLLAVNDREADLWVGYGDMLRFVGRRGEAGLAYRRALLADGGFGSAWWSLANLDAKAVTDRDVERMEAALTARADRPEDIGSLHFALGEVFDRRGRHADAFAHFADGNALRERAQPYDPAVLTGEVDQSIAVFTEQFFASHQAAPSNRSDRPVFIVGMPRSGSTLIERILGRHPEIEAVGELPIIPRMIEMLNAQGGGIGGYRKVVADLPPDRLAELANTYLERSLHFRRTGKSVFIDKLHMNWRHAGFIRLILPDAVIIDARRDPLDCCWSNFKMLFTRGHPAASNLANIGRFYVDYVRMTDFLRRAAPDKSLLVPYEDVVGDVAAQTRRMLDALGLPFDARCLDFHLSDEPVATASSEQVRRPLNRDGIGVAAPYAAWLQPLIDALAPLAIQRG